MAPKRMYYSGGGWVIVAAIIAPNRAGRDEVKKELYNKQRVAVREFGYCEGEPRFPAAAPTVLSDTIASEFRQLPELRGARRNRRANRTSDLEPTQPFKY